MALQTKTFTVGVVGDVTYNRYALELILTEDTVSQVSNTSRIFYTLNLKSGSRNFSGYGVGAEISLGGRVVAVRDQATEPRKSIGKNDTLTVLSGTVDVPHNADGTLDMEVAFWLNTPVEDYTPGYMAFTGGTMPLTRIPRASTLRGTSANIQEVSVLAITRYSTAFTHSVKYTFGKQTGYISSEGNGVGTEEKFSATSLGFLIPESFYDEIPNSPSGICHLEITTYAGATKIGTEKTTITVTASPARCAPVVEFSAEDVNPVTLRYTGNSSILIRGVSTVRCTVSARGQKGASVASVLVNGKQDMEFTPMTGQLEATVTDSRGYVTRQPLDMTMVEYVLLSCNVSAKRVDATGGQVHLQVWGQYFDGEFPLQANQLAVTCRLPDDRVVTVPCTVSEHTYQGETVLTDLSYKSAHTLQITAMDRLCQVERMTTVNRGVPVFDWGQEDFVFHVPVTAEGGIGGVYMQAFSGTGLWLHPAQRPQSYLIAGDGVLGVLTATLEGCVWQGTGDVTEVSGENSAGLLFPADTRGVILSNSHIQ